jgi:hypothetical protein
MQTDEGCEGEVQRERWVLLERESAVGGGEVRGEAGCEVCVKPVWGLCVDAGRGKSKKNKNKGMDLEDKRGLTFDAEDGSSVVYSIRTFGKTLFYVILSRGS